MQKQETNLLGDYDIALNMLYRGNVQDGMDALKKILQNPIISNRQFSNLRFSVFQSLSELAQNHTKNINEAIYFLHESLKIKDTFIDWKRLSELCRHQRYFDQAQFCLKKSLSLAPIIHQDILLRRLIQIKILNSNFREALQILNDLIAKQIIVVDLLPLKLMCLRRLIVEEPDEVARVVYEKQAMVMERNGVRINQQILEEEQRLSVPMEIEQQSEKHNESEESVPFEIRQGTCWLTLLCKLHLIIKYAENQDKKKKTYKIHKNLEEYFTEGKAHKMLTQPIRIVMANSEQESLDQLTQAYVQHKKKKANETLPKIQQPETNRQYVKVTGNINIKDYISNQAVHIDSLVDILAKHKKQDMTKLNILKDICEDMCPTQHIFPNAFEKCQKPLEQVLIMEYERGDRQKQEKQEEEVKEVKTPQNTETSQNDLNVFFNCRTNRCYPNIVFLIHDIVRYFTTCELRNIDKDEQYRQSLIMTPHYLMKTSENSLLKQMIFKLYFKSCQVCKNLYDTTSCKITFLELLVEKYMETSTKAIGCKNRDKVKMLEGKKSEINKMITKFHGEMFYLKAFGQWMESLPKLSQEVLRTRIFHCFSLYFSMPDSEDKQLLNRMLVGYENSQSAYQSLTGNTTINLFWLDIGSSKVNLREFTTNRLYENQLQNEIHRGFQQINSVLRTSIDNFRRTSTNSITEAIQLYFKNIVELMSNEQLNLGMFLQFLTEILSVYVESLENKPPKQEYSKYMVKLDGLMKDEDLFQQLVKRVNYEKELTPVVLMNLLKLTCVIMKIILIRLMILQEVHHHLRGLMCCLTLLIRNMTEQQKLKYVSELVLLLHMLSHIPSQNMNIHKRVNSQFVQKYLQYMFKDSRLVVEEESEEQDYKLEVEEVLRCYYGFSQKKLAEFNPTTMQQLQFFVSYLKLFQKQTFDRSNSRIKVPVCNILKQGQKIIYEEKNKLCNGLQEVRKRLVEMCIGKKDEELWTKMETLLQNQKVSLCSCDQENCFDKIKSEEFIDTLFMVAKSLQNDDLNDSQSSKNELQKTLRHSERLYQLLVLLAPQQGRSWYGLFRINKKKAFLYFDSLVYQEQLNDWRSCFITAKKIASMVKDKLSGSVKIELEEDLFILNLLKVYQRKFLYIVSRETQPQNREETVAKLERLMQAYQTFSSKLDTRSLRVDYLRTVYLLRPYYFKKDFKSATCIELFKKLTKLRHDMVDLPDDDDQPRLSQEELQSAVLVLITKIMKRYVDIYRLTEEKLVLADLAEWILAVNNSMSHLLLPSIMNNYFDNYLKSKPPNEKYRSSLNNIKEAWKEDNPTVDQKSTVELFNTIIGNILQQLKLLCNIKKDAKKIRLQRWRTSSCYYLSKLQLDFLKDSKMAQETLSELINIKSDDIIQIYRYYQKQSLERDQKLGDFFNRNLYFMITKIRYIKYVMKLCVRMEDYEKIRMLYRKLIKLNTKDDSSHRTNIIFGLLQATCLTDSIESLWILLAAKEFSEDNEKWLYELAEKVVKQKKDQKNALSERIKSLVAAYYVKRQRDCNSAVEIPENGRYQKGIAILQQKFKKKKLQPQSK